MITTQKQLRKTFWETFPNLSARKLRGQNCYTADTRVTFVEWIDALCKDGTISPELAQRAEL